MGVHETTGPEARSRAREIGVWLALFVLILFLWNTWAVYPLKILVVFFHELSHGLAAILTGGRIVEIQVVAQEGGLCITMGGSRFVVLSAGYLGSLACGGALLVLAARTKHDNLLAVALGGLLVLCSLVWVRPIVGFGFAFGVLSGAALAAAGIYLPGKVNDALLRVLGLTSCLYAILDIKSDILDRPELRSDARMLAELTHLPVYFWGVVWILLAIAGAGYFLWVASGGHSKDRDAAGLGL